MNAAAELGAVISLRDVCVRREGNSVLTDITWRIEGQERWVMLGPNGSGKTTLLGVVGARLWPTSGEVLILGSLLGRVDVRTLRPRIAFVSGAVVRQLRADQPARDVVTSGRFGALETWWHHYDEADWRRADALLAQSGVGHVAGRPFGVISEGERQQVLLARALMSDPDLLLLDEPFAGLDLGARERLLSRLGQVAEDRSGPPLVLVTHHCEEVPRGITHAALLSEGRLVAAGPIDEVLTSGHVSEAFGVEVSVGRADGRWWSRAQ